MVLGKLPVPGRPTIWIIVGQGPIALAIGAGGGCLDIFTLLYPFPSFPFLWETARYRLKYCLKGPLNPKQPTNQYTTNKIAVKASSTPCINTDIRGHVLYLFGYKSRVLSPPKQPQKSVSVVLEGKILTAAQAKTD